MLAPRALETVYPAAIARARGSRYRLDELPGEQRHQVTPQFAGLGSSQTSQRFAIKSMAEAETYLRHPLLGSRLVECGEAVMDVNGRSAYEIFGSPDDAKLRSCATLFAQISDPGSVFERLLSKYFEGLPDQRTLDLIGGPPAIR